ncbi:hypothetical protein HMPREF0682_2083 [Propionibacterium acidifaciens F0233]|uniref:Uncharacterized protein n=1 Tax=Propionibacterium acidifaciens F0233 TaxID=553198 RepID=U2RU90_9ACTN|nr:hypothetical protein HMPREF0682_2083 [Propionibacterium acidifaciens F0233]
MPAQATFIRPGQHPRRSARVKGRAHRSSRPGRRSGRPSTADGIPPSRPVRAA